MLEKSSLSKILQNIILNLYLASEVVSTGKLKWKQSPLETSPRIPGVGPGGVVDESVFEQGEEDEGDAHVGPHVYRLGGNITPSSTLDKGSKENIYTDTPYQTI